MHFAAIILCTFFHIITHSEGALDTPLADQNSMFFDFLEENSMFLGVFFRQIVCSPPHPGKLCPPGKKSADAHVIVF